MKQTNNKKTFDFLKNKSIKHWILSYITIATIPFAVAEMDQYSSYDGQGREQQMQPPEHRHHKPPKLNITDEQKSCLDEILGSPEDSQVRPTKEALEAAFKTCKISTDKLPKHHEHKRKHRNKLDSVDESSANGNSSSTESSDSNSSIAK